MNIYDEYEIQKVRILQDDMKEREELIKKGLELDPEILLANREQSDTANLDSLERSVRRLKLSKLVQNAIEKFHQLTVFFDTVDDGENEHIFRQLDAYEASPMAHKHFDRSTGRLVEKHTVLF